VTVNAFSLAPGGLARVVQFRDPQIEMAHGAGGKATRRLIDTLLAPLLLANHSEPLSDAALVDVGRQHIALTADAFVVRPLTFAGGSIGTLAVHGTVNDLAVSAAVPKALVVTFVLEAGLPGAVLEGEVRAMAEAARRAGVHIVGGDTKVVEYGKADGITVLLARGQVTFDADLRSDTRSVWSLVDSLLDAAGAGVRWMRDPTRGGIATALKELAHDTGRAIVLQEEQVPVREAVRGVCEILGLDPLHIANEGQFLAVVAPEYADRACAALRATAGGEAAVLVGEVRDSPSGAVIACSNYGTSRAVDMLVGDPLPRIC
jgi:hydrogenase expression/formation protein HypE